MPARIHSDRPGLARRPVCTSRGASIDTTRGSKTAQRQGGVAGGGGGGAPERFQSTPEKHLKLSFTLGKIKRTHRHTLHHEDLRRCALKDPDAACGEDAWEKLKARPRSSVRGASRHAAEGAAPRHPPGGRVKDSGGGTGSGKRSQSIYR